MTDRKIRVLIVEDDADFVFLIRKMLMKYTQIEIAGVCGDKASAVELALAKRPDITVMDLHLGRSVMDGVAASREIRVLTETKVLILTAYDSPEIVLKAAREAFASGYIFKNQMNLLADSIIAAAGGYTAQEYLIATAALSCLSEAEMSVFRIMMGEEIHLQSSPKTIANQKTRILKKLGLENQKELRHVFRLFPGQKEI